MAKDPTFENAIAFAADLIRIPGLSGSEGDVARRVRVEMEALGLDDARLDEAGNAIGVARGTGDAPSVLLNCHLDVVAEGDHADWEFPPFSGVVEGGFLHGRGAMDIKGQLALQTYAAAALKGKAPGDVIVAHTVFEERGGLGMKHLLESGVRPGAVIIGEATRGDICIGHRGRAEVEVVITGLAGHASAPERAHNALDLVGDVLLAVRDVAEGLPADPILGRATVVATMLDVLPQSRNVIPDNVVVALDWRTLPNDEDPTLLRQVREALGRRLPEVPQGLDVTVRMAQEHQRTHTGLEVERDMFSPGFLMDPDHPMVEAAARAVGRRDDASTPAVVRPWTFATDGGWTCGVHGVPTLGFAPGEERFAHTNRERLDVEEARWAFHRHGDLVVAMQKALT
ncbi:MAG: M20/M25/M40 family metallo-hydrolase [Gemmatimonadetes bacterium]|nr:M20/M25/M40 family metallo-hydrolase [Gemmatimonadota bacterium]